jgi:hypothetical protein
MVLWHDTETSGFPSYSSGFWPNMTINPTTGEARQHIPANRAGRALRNESGGVQTNRWRVFQIEVLGFANEVAFHPVMAEVAEWAHDRLGVPLRSTVTWMSYPSSFGQTSVRLSSGEWSDYAGHLAHMHVPENDHGDPGRPFPIDRILAGTAPAPAPELPKETDMFILRCDPISGQGGRQLRLVNGQRHRVIATAVRTHLKEREGVIEYDLTGHPDIYDQILSLAEEAPEPEPTG